MVKTYSTKEVSLKIGVSMDTLQFWARQEMLTPEASGEGKRRRLTWSEDDVSAAEVLRDTQRIGELMRKAREAKETVFDGRLVAAGFSGVKKISPDTPAIEILRRAGPFCILLG